MALKDFIGNKPVLTADRLTLRPLRESDVDALRTWTPRKELYAHWGKGPGKADKDPSLLFPNKDGESKSFHWAIADRATDFAFGDFWVYLIENDRMAKVAFRISPDWQGRGLAAEALRTVVDFCFSRTELRRLWTDVSIENVASIRTLEKCGFLREGTIRQGKMVSTWCDYHLYALLNTDPLPARS